MDDQKPSGDPTEYLYYYEALAGRFGPIEESNPQSGFYRSGRGLGAEPVAIWRQDGVLCMLRGHRDVSSDLDVWVGCAKHPVRHEEYSSRLTEGRWPSDPPEEVPAAEPIVDKARPPPAKIGSMQDPAPMGHNSGDPNPFETQRAAIADQIAEARSYFHHNPIKTKTDADRCENWRQRIHAMAARFEEMRVAERRPLQEQLQAIQDRYLPTLKEAESVAAARGELDRLGQAWIRAERARLQQEAEAKARAEQEARRVAVEAERARLEAERENLRRDDPVAFETSAAPELPLIPAESVPVVVAPKVMIGTGGTRRGVREEPHTATITDLKALAAYYAGVNHPQLVELLQKLANNAARSSARTALPGVVMSWEGKAA